MKEYRVVVHGVGDIGCVTGANEDDARCAALSKYGADGLRFEAAMSDEPHPSFIYEDDEFDVRPA